MSTDDAPSRTVSGLRPAPARRVGVHPDASRLLRGNRPAAPAAEAAVPAQPAPGATPAPARPPNRAPRLQPEAGPLKEQLNVAILRDVRRRIRAAYRATGAAEGHRSLSDLVTAVLAAEAQRLEARYNNGQPFDGGDQHLPPGRPLSD